MFRKVSLDEAEQVPFQPQITSEESLAAVALALGAGSIKGITDTELRLVSDDTSIPSQLADKIRERIGAGQDPLGSIFCSIRTSEIRRRHGAIYTPGKIVQSMLDWAILEGEPERIIEPGAGTAPFLLEAAKRFPNAQLVAVETDPLAALLARANLAATGLGDRSCVLLEDFRHTQMSRIDGQTLFVGNPPYVRHHWIGTAWKSWLKNTAGEMGIRASALAGLHVYFFLMIARWAKSGDYGALITAGEWLDINYGQMVRDLFLGRLGGKSVVIIEPKAGPFPGVASTGAITTFKIDGKPTSAGFSRVADLENLKNLQDGVQVPRERLQAESRWSHFTRAMPQKPEGYIELGELCAVHRGQVTGANRVWISGVQGANLPTDTLFPTVTRAKEIITSDLELSDPNFLRRVVDLPEDLSGFSGEELNAIRRFLVWAECMGARDSYIARHRRAWWSVGLREPAPILATYMARRPPVFVLNQANVRHLNIAHGLYPRESLSSEIAKKLVQYLRTSVSALGGRVYAGGLTKFEPKEMERIPVPDLQTLRQMEL
jgi:hypothetical protein